MEMTALLVVYDGIFMFHFPPVRCRFDYFSDSHAFVLNPFPQALFVLQLESVISRLVKLQPLLNIGLEM